MGIHVTWLLLLAVSSAPTIEPPVVGRPAQFSGGVGQFRVSMQAAPTELEAEEPLTLTVRVTGSGTLDQVRRPDLRQLPRFARQFHVEDLGERLLADGPAREFDYRLRPRSPDVGEIPSLPFVYFRPGVIPDYKGYQTTYAPAIPLTVRPRTPVPPAAVQGAVPLPPPPEIVYALATGPAVLHPDPPPWSQETLLLLALALLAPPVACASWLALWRRLAPDADRRRHLRLSGAARQALRALRRAAPGRDPTRAASVVVDYLRARYELHGNEPTAIEVEAHLGRHGIAADLAGHAGALLRAADAARFAPEGAPVHDWTATATDLIHTLEAAACASSSSA